MMMNKTEQIVFLPLRKLMKFFSSSHCRPVSAYALFFRDTQASIKGQNPNASFGEVSKIVASMWDVLAPDHKNVSLRDFLAVEG
jgi:HMG (high mobility group) box